MTIELLFFDGCPSYEALLPELRTLIQREGIEEEIQLRRIESPEVADRERFLGSPTIRIDGADIDPGAAGRSDFGLKCRLYSTAEGLSGSPPEQWILESIRCHRADAKH